MSHLQGAVSGTMIYDYTKQVIAFNYTGQGFLEIYQFNAYVGFMFYVLCFFFETILVLTCRMVTAIPLHSLCIVSLHLEPASLVVLTITPGPSRSTGPAHHASHSLLARRRMECRTTQSPLRVVCHGQATLVLARRPTYLPISTISNVCSSCPMSSAAALTVSKASRLQTRASALLHSTLRSVCLVLLLGLSSLVCPLCDLLFFMPFLVFFLPRSLLVLPCVSVILYAVSCSLSFDLLCQLSSVLHPLLLALFLTFSVGPIFQYSFEQHLCLQSVYHELYQLVLLQCL